MAMMKSTADFREFCRKMTSRKDTGRPCLVICAGTGGQASGSNDIIRIIKRQILGRHLEDRLALRITGCLGFCEMDPFILVEPQHALYPKLDMKHVPRIIDAVLNGEVVEELLYREPGTTRKCKCQEDIPFFKGQKRIILGTNQRIDPIRIIDYMADTKPCGTYSTPRIPKGSLEK